MTLAIGATAFLGAVLSTSAEAADWTGATSNDWFTAGNWSTSAVPTSSINAIIDTTSPNPTSVDGANAVAQTLDIGHASGGVGSLTILNGGTINNGKGSIGVNAGSSGTVTVDGVGSAWVNSGILSVGDFGTAKLDILNGGAISSNQGFLAFNAGSNATMTVDGIGSTWTNADYVYVGANGVASLTISNGGKVQNTFALVGAGNGSGTVNVTGTGSTWTNSGDLTVGALKTGALVITSGGTVSSTNGVLGNVAGSTGTATVDGAGSIWTNSGSLIVGNVGVGTLTISNGGKVSNSWAHLGGSAGSTGTVLVDGAGSTWTNSSNLFVGNQGTGTLTISSGGVVSNASGLVGAFSGSIGTVTVDGAGSAWVNSSDVFVGGIGKGTLTISNGGTVSNGWGYVGEGAGSTGTVSVTGVGSAWANTGDITVGNNGTGTLLISNGGMVSNNFAILGNVVGSQGTVVVNGVGSTWATSADLSIGWNGVGALTIENGGTVSSAFGGLSVNIGAVGTAVVDGAGSTWTNTGNLIVGVRGIGILTIANGGVVSNADGILGYDPGATGTVTVEGSNSVWTNSGNLTVGRDGAGTLTIANRGVVSASGVVLIASQAGSIGTLNIGGAVGALATAAGTLNAANLVFGLGTGAINFNHTDTNYTFAPAISGVGTINQVAGNTVLTADSSGFAGATTITGGRLAVNGSLANSLVTVSGGGILGGNGIVGGIVANAGGIIAPGNSIGTLNVNGNISQAAGSTYQVELTSTGLSDLVKATGTVTIANGATLNVIKLDAAPYALGTHYTVLQADGGVSGAYTLTGDTSLSAFIGLIASYDPSHVYLDVAQTKSFASAGLTPNQVATGGGADSLPLSNPLFNAIVWLPTNAVARYAFDQLSGEIHASARTALIEDSRFVRNAANDRLRAAFDSAGSSTATVVTYDAHGRPRATAANTDRFAFWGQGFGSWGRTNGDGNAARIERSTGGFLIGADGQLPDTWRIGVLGGYSRTTFNVKDRHSSGASDNYHLGLYGGTQWGDFALRTGMAYTWHDISTSRSVIFPGFVDSLKGNYNAGTTQIFGELGYGIRAGSFAFEPFANLAYVNLHTNSFRETGKAAALTGAGASTSTTFTTLGLRATTSFTLGGTTAALRGMLGWRHAFGGTVPLTTMALAGSGSAFTIGGVPITRDAAVMEAGLDFALSPNAILGVSYGGQFGSGLSVQSVKANFNLKF
ncbi:MULTISPECIES: autotransporter domain-containing protein [unclassified Beijerinckia]|uniref:autotransporter outer membrane beta-barrel domain-containing protein n=1 Tax=unclassified Beijerinckia TaxID=2638183 RepID=UPI00089AC99F|nr:MULTISPECIES: autotransporter domain-containing protein [unclassified Beijerinckia]MDH7794226.1 outer membrane autotransporter protein [Beijerinckia sp. GAS462]SEB56262.1 outer membrane autotransporter barrel domain-containing protein [Beijerinckia sp. 28-YEA-48]